MRCFNHPEREAVGSCKACCKGLCPDCVADRGHGLACRGIHEEQVDTLYLMIVRNARVQSTSRRAKYLAPAFTAFMGTLFLTFGYLHEGLHGFLVPMGAGFLGYSVVIFFVKRRAFGQLDSNTQLSLEQTR